MHKPGGDAPVPPRGRPGALGRSQAVARYGSVDDEYARIRSGVALADRGCTGKFQIAGRGALEAVNRLVVSDVSRLPLKKLLATFMLREDASILCEAYVANLGGTYLVLTEGSQPDRVASVIEEVCQSVRDAEVADITAKRTLLSLDGPYSWELLKEMVGTSILGARYLDVITDQHIGDIPLVIYRAGATGEFGYWLDVAADAAPELWQKLLAAGMPFDLIPYGYEAGDLCRLENRFINMQCEGATARSILEVNCRTMVSLEKGDYVGRAAIEKTLERGPLRRLIGFAMPQGNDRVALPGVGDAVTRLGTVVGQIASARFSPTLKRGIAVAFLDTEYAYVGLDFEIGSTAGPQLGRTVSAPFVLNRSLGVRFQEHSYLDPEHP